MMPTTPDENTKPSTSENTLTSQDYGDIGEAARVVENTSKELSKIFNDAEKWGDQAVRDVLERAADVLDDVTDELDRLYETGAPNYGLPPEQS